MAELPEDLKEIQEGLERSDLEARRLIAALDEERFNWRPDPRSWSVAQCLDHLNVANRVYLEPIRVAIEQARAVGASRRDPIHESWSAGSSAAWIRRRAAVCRRRARSYPRRAGAAGRFKQSGTEDR